MEQLDPTDPNLKDKIKNQIDTKINNLVAAYSGYLMAAIEQSSDEVFDNVVIEVKDLITEVKKRLIKINDIVSGNEM